MSQKLTALAWYLLGETPKSQHSIIWDTSRRNCIPTISSPIANYLHEVNRFLFDGGLNIDVEEANSDDPRQQFLDTLVNKNRIQSSLESIWETGAIDGELLCVLRLSGNSYSMEWFSKWEFDYEDSLDGLQTVVVKAERLIDDVEYIYRLDIDSSQYTEYPLVEKRYAHNFDWAANAMPQPHTYGKTPAAVIKNKHSISKRRGLHEFNFAACKTAAAAIMATFESLENVHLFGTPMLVSPDPDDTLKRLKARLQVLQKESQEDGGGVDVLQYNAIQDEHLQLITKLEDSFNRLMGIRMGGADVRSADVSSLTLRILNSATISKAESKWQNYITDGLKPLFELCLQMAAIDGMLLGVNINDYSTYKLSITRKKPYFVESPLEVGQQLTVAQQLVDLGVDRIEALKSTIWPGLSYGQIEEKLRINLEDI